MNKPLFAAASLSLGALISCSQFSPATKSQQSAVTSTTSGTKQTLAPKPQVTQQASKPKVESLWVQVADLHSPQTILFNSRAASAKNDPNISPNVVPPNFQQEKWNNRIPLFNSDSIGVFTSDFGWRQLNGKANFHNGVDVWVKPGTTVLSPVSGEIVLARSAGKASEIVIRKGDLLHTLLHIEPAPSVSKGRENSKGQILGTQSSHNHFEYAVYLVPDGDVSARSRDNAVNPFALHKVAHLVD